MATLDLKTTKLKVEWCLTHRPTTRGDDHILTLVLWKNFYRRDYEDMIIKCLQSIQAPVPISLGRDDGDMGKLPSFESCRRLRQKFNENGLYLPTDKTILKRRGKTPEILEFLKSDRLF